MFYRISSKNRWKCEPKLFYFLNIPKTLGKEDSIENLIKVIEGLKNGLLVSLIYDRYKYVLMKTPHVVILTNQKCPNQISKKSKLEQRTLVKFRIGKNSDLL